jgi:hypothetical protein
MKVSMCLERDRGEALFTTLGRKDRLNLHIKDNLRRVSQMARAKFLKAMAN